MNVTDEMIDAATAILQDEDHWSSTLTSRELAERMLEAALDVADTPCCCGDCGV